MTNPRIHIPATSARVQLAAAFVAVYIIWGSTYLAIAFADETMPPFPMAAARFLIAGALVYAWARSRGAARPTAANWKAAAIVGGLLLMAGNGVVSWAEQTVPSGLAALLVGTVPLWMAVIEWLRPGGHRPRLPLAIGLLLGFAGVALLFGPGALGGGKAASIAGALAIVCAAFCWASGSLYSRTAPLPSVPALGNGMEMLAGGALLLVLSLVTGQLGQIHLDHVSTRSWLGLLYLIVFGSIVAYSAYLYMLRKASVAAASTYAYVNPVVAVALGVAFNGEKLTPLTLVASAVIVAAVVVITTFRAPRQTTPATESRPATEPLSDGPAMAGRSSR
jgi:drug/metabolite transporter (DMT)-like permease